MYDDEYGELGDCDECGKALTTHEHDRDRCERCGHFVHDPLEDFNGDEED